MIDYETYLTGPSDDVLALELAGRLDENTAAFLLDALTGWVDKGYRRFVLDCEQLEHITSFGLAALVRLHTRLRKVGGDVKLAVVGGRVADVVRVVHLEKLLHIYDSVESASQSFETHA